MPLKLHAGPRAGWQGWWVAACVVAACTVVASVPARAADQGKLACAHAAEEGQRLRTRGALRQALAAFKTCASDRCPAMIRSDCAVWLGEVDAALPTIVVRATAAEEPGRELYEVDVRIDGALATRKLDGGALPIDPGEHRLDFAATARRSVSESVVIRVGEKHRLIAVALPSLRPPPPTPAAVAADAPAPPPRRVGAAVKVLAIVGAAALVSAAAFGTSGWLEARSLRKSCAPQCSDEQISSVRLRLRVADASLAAGVLALAGAGWLAWGRSSPSDGATEALVTPLPSGALVALRGTFGAW